MPADATPVVAIYRTEVLPLSETFVRDQARALRRWRPVLLGERSITGLARDGIEEATLHRGAATGRQRLVSAGWRELGAANPAMVALARRVAPRLIHAHFGFDGAEIAPLARRLGVPLVVTLHGSDITVRADWYASGRAGRRWRRYPRRLAALAERSDVTFIAVSRHIRAAALAAGLPDARVVVLPIGVDTSRFTPADLPVGRRRPIVLFVGRLVEKKGGVHLAAAFRRVREHLPEAELVVAGDGPERAGMEAALRDCGGVRFLGAVDDRTVAALLLEARVLCLPSVTAASGDAEGFGLVILEAQASGVPVVTSARGGAEEGILDGETGIAFAEGDVCALQEGLLTLLTDDVLADRMGHEARRFAVERHELGGRTAALERLYDDVVGRCR